MSKWIAEFELEDGDTMPEHTDLEYKGAKIDFHCRPVMVQKVDAEPVGYGKWVDPEAFKRPWFRHHIFECSVCRNTLDMDGVNAGRGDANYCPNCGAKMDGREENETIRSASGY